MRLTQIRIDRFGTWQDLELPLSEHGVTVLYGPNEAGKSTLMRFIRGVLYGFPSVEHRAPATRWNEPAASGSLGVRHREHVYEIRRAADAASRGLVSVTGANREESTAELLAEMLSGVEERLFEGVFAVGLHEIQQLATLHDEDVARLIYGLSLGPDGRQLLDATSRLEHDAGLLIDPNARTGSLIDYLERDVALGDELDAAADIAEQHAEFCRERDSLLDRISEMKSRQVGMHSQLRGHLFLERVWPSWKQAREYRQELAKLPAISSFPENGLARLDKLDHDIESAVRCRDALKGEAVSFRKQASALKLNPQIREHSATIQGLLDQQEHFTRIGEEVVELDSEANKTKTELNAALQQLGPEWSLEKLEKVDISPASQFGLMSAARNYEQALRARSRLRHRCRSASQRCRRTMAQLDEQVKKLGGVSWDQAVSAAQKRLSDLEGLGQLRLREADLDQQQARIHEQLFAGDERSDIPKWIYPVFIFFVAAGLFFFLLGFWRGVQTSMIGGLAYAVLGATCGVIGWAFKRHASGAKVQHFEQLEERQREVETELRRTRESINRITGASESGRDLSPAELAAKSNAQADQARLIAGAVRRVADCERWRQEHERIEATRERLSGLRSKLQVRQHDLSNARESWCKALTAHHLPETVNIDEGFENWQRLVAAATKLHAWKPLARQLSERKRELETFRRRVETLGRQMDSRQHDYSQSLAVISLWEQELREYKRSRNERKRLAREEQKRHTEAAEYQQQIDDWNAKRNALLVEAGAANREDFEKRDGWYASRLELDELLGLANADLESAAKTEPNLAVVEDDLVVFNPDQNAECIRALNAELESIDRDLLRVHEQLGSVKQEIKTIEGDRSLTKLKFDHAQNDWRMRHAAEEWFAQQLAARAVEQIRSLHERTCQPEVLSMASHYLDRLTRGRYRNVWTPLGKRRLCVDDEHRTWQVEQLSGGTREQLFLAVRLALVAKLSTDGIELPFVLDDIMVNFDQSRTEAAAETLLEVASHGQQVLLFTCHQHLAEMFQHRGVEPIWLPDHRATLEERLAG